MGKIEQYAEDSIIINEGEINQDIYKIISGKAALYLHYGKENEFFVCVLPEQRFFGEIGFLTKHSSPFSVVAISDVTAMRVTEDEFEKFIISNPHNAIDIMRCIAKSVVTLNKHIDLIIEEMENSLKNVENKKDLIDIREKIQQYRMSSFNSNQFEKKI